jgi:hypothetical protein
MKLGESPPSRANMIELDLLLQKQYTITHFYFKSSDLILTVEIDFSRKTLFLI